MTKGLVADGVMLPYNEDDNFLGHNYGTNDEYQISSFFSLFLGLLLTCILISNAVGKVKCDWFPEAGVPLLIGIIMGTLCLLHSGYITDSLLGFDPTIFFTALLPPIIFHSGFSIKRRFFFQNFASILTFALAGTLMSAISTGILLFMLGKSGVSGVALSFAECLTFGSLISATDPVSTLAIFQELRVDPQLFYLVFGESVLNDAVSIVLFRTFSKFIGYTHTVKSVVIAVFDFFIIFIGSTLVGILIGCTAALLFKFYRFDAPVHEISVLVLFSYLPFLIAESVQMSGIVSILFAGMTMKHYTFDNLSEVAKDKCEGMFRLIAYIAETAVFLNLGLSVVALRMGYNLRLIGWAMFICLVSRGLNIYPLSFLLNCVRKEKISMKQQHMLWFSGLRGAIAFALSLSFPGNHKTEIITTTMAIVVLSVFVMGGGTVKVLKMLGIKRLTPEEERETDLTTRPAKKLAFLRFDAKYLAQFFTRRRTIQVHRDSPGEQSPDDLVPVDLNALQAV